MDIRELADFAVDNHYRIEGSGTIEEVFRAIAVIYGRKYGFAWDGKSNKLKTLKKKLKEGKITENCMIKCNGCGANVYGAGKFCFR